MRRKIAVLMTLVLGITAQAWGYSNPTCPTDDLVLQASVGGAPVAGDFNKDGTVEYGAYSSGRWSVDLNRNGIITSPPETGDAEYFFGTGGYPVYGDFDGNGTLDLGYFSAGRWVIDLNNNLKEDAGDRIVTFGQANDLPVFGDFNGDGTWQIGVFRAGNFILDLNRDWVLTPGVDPSFPFGQAGDLPVVGNWTGSGVSMVGVYRKGEWRLDRNGNFRWDGEGTDILYAALGRAGLPLAGDWNGDRVDQIGFLEGSAGLLDTTADGRLAIGTCDPSLLDPTGTFDPNSLPTVSDGSGVCSQDQNNNGTIEPEEIDNCSNGICPIGMQKCGNGGGGAPICPPGAVLNGDRDMCQSAPNIVCPVSYIYDAQLDKCLSPVQCQEAGAAYNPATGQCEKTVLTECPQGYVVDAAAQKCVKSIDCGPLSVYNQSMDRCDTPPNWDCPTGMTLSSISNTCVAPPSCLAGTNYSPLTDRCETVAIGSCAPGFAFDATLGRCIRDADCDGGTLNPLTDQCELSAAQTCAPGYTLNGTGQCESVPTCEPPGVYSQVTKTCQADSTGVTCPTGYVFSAGQCTAAPICANGTFVPATGRCETPPGYSCPTAGYSYVAAMGRCERAPSCTLGTYHPGFNLCLLPSTPGCGPGYAYQESRGRCERAPMCPTADYIYNPAANACQTPVSAQPIGIGSWEFSHWQCNTCNFVAGVMGDNGIFANAIRKVGGTPTIWTSMEYIQTGTYWDDFTGTYIPSYEWLPRYNVRFNAGGFPTFNFHNTTALLTLIRPGDVMSYDHFTGFSINGGLLNIFAGGGSKPWFYTRGTNTCLQPIWMPKTSNTPGHWRCGDLANGQLTCPAGYQEQIFNGSKACIRIDSVAPNCPSGTMDYTYDVCYAANNPQCSAGTVYSPAAGSCISNAVCTGGLLDGSRDVCFQAVTYGCTNGMTLIDGVCTIAPVCANGGTFSSVMGQCTTPAVYNCPGGGYVYQAATGVCERAVTCGNPGALNPVSDLCETPFVLDCPANFVLDGSLCRQNPRCADPGTFSASLDRCVDTATSVCAPGLDLDAPTSTCWVSAACPGGALNTGSDQCEASAAVNCGTLSWDSALQVCFTPKVCTPGLFNALDNRCETSITYNCGTMDYDAPTGKCVDNPQCPTDASFTGPQQFEFTRLLDICVNPPKIDCVPGMSYIGLPVRMCESIIQCPANSIYDVATNTCSGVGGGTICPAGDFPCAPTASSAQIIKGCPNGGSLDSVKKLCVRDGVVVTGAVDLSDYYYFYPEAGVPNRLVTDLLLGGPGLGDKSYLEFSVAGGRVVVTGRMWQDGYWSAEGQGESIVWSDAQGAVVGTLTVTHANGLVSVSGLPVVIPDILDLRPTDGQLAFYTPGGGLVGSITLAPKLIEEAPLTESETFCSPNPCSPDPSISEEPDFQDFQNDGAVDPATGECLGLVKIFNGKGKYCLKPGVKTSFFNCCNPDPSSFLFVEKVCPTQSTEVALAQHQGRAYYLGDFCVQKWPAVGCVQQAKVYCVFESKLARMVHEQGRMQLKDFQPAGNWGTPQQPNCEGFSPAEFSAIDFGRLDLSEAFPDLAPTVNDSTIKQDATNAIQNYFSK